MGLDQGQPTLPTQGVPGQSGLYLHSLSQIITLSIKGVKKDSSG